jgi:hypothetical protein
MQVLINNIIEYIITSVKSSNNNIGNSSSGIALGTYSNALISNKVSNKSIAVQTAIAALEEGIRVARRKISIANSSRGSGTCSNSNRES